VDRIPAQVIDPQPSASSNFPGTRTQTASTHARSDPKPTVEQAMRALREMPPFAREREIETGRYSHLSAKEKQLLRSVQ